MSAEVTSAKTGPPASTGSTSTPVYALPDTQVDMRGGGDKSTPIE